MNLTAAAGESWTCSHAGCSSLSHRTTQIQSYTYRPTDTDDTRHCSYAADTSRQRPTDRVMKGQTANLQLAEQQQCETTCPPLLCFGFVLRVNGAVSSHSLSQTLDCCCCEITVRLSAAPGCSQSVQETINHIFTGTAVTDTYRGLIRSVINDFDYWQSELTFPLFWDTNVSAVGAASRAATHVFDKLIIFPTNHLVNMMSKKCKVRPEDIH